MNDHVEPELSAVPVPVFALGVNDVGVVTSAVQSNTEQPSMTTVSEAVYLSAVGRIGACKMVDGALQDYAPPAEPAFVPDSASRLGLKRALAEIGKWDQAKAAIASNADVQEEWDLAISIKRDDPLTGGIIRALDLTSADVDNLLIRAAALTG